MPAASHPFSKKRFHAVFHDMQPPSQARLFDFFTHYKLSCLVDKTAPLQGFLKQLEDTPQQYIVCVPMSDRLSPDLIQKCSGLIQETYLPIVLYWNWESPDHAGYVAFRISLVPCRADSSVGYSVALCHPAARGKGVPVLTRTPPITSFLRGLEDELGNTLTMNPVDVSYLNEPLEGDTLYEATLSLFLRLCEDETGFRQHFITWHTANPPHLTRLDRIEQHVNAGLQFVPGLYPPLFYFEQTLPIFNMVPQVHHLGDHLIPAWLRALPPRTSLHVIRLGAAGYLLYQGMRDEHGHFTLTEEGYGTLQHLALMVSIHGLTTHLRHKVSAGLATIVLFYTCPLVVTGGHQLLTLYLKMPPSTTPIQSTTVALRYGLMWMESISRELIILGIRLSTMLPVLLLIAHVLRNAHPDQQDGFRAIGVLSIQLFMMFVVPCLVELNRFTGWKGRQSAEEQVIYGLEAQCKPPCQFTVKPSFWRRLCEFTFFDKQTTRLAAREGDAIMECELNVTASNTSLPTGIPPETVIACSDTILSCSSRGFFDRAPSTNDNRSLAFPHRAETITVHPPVKVTYCMVKPRSN